MTDTGCHAALSAREGDGVESDHDHRHRNAPLATILVGASPLRPEDVVAVARHGARVELDAGAMARVAASRALVEGLADDPEPHYGISTGLRRARDHLHRPGAAAAAAGEPHPLARGRHRRRGRARGRARAAAAAPADARDRATPACARSSSRRTPAMLNAGITPIVREYGSLGCSGDLAPLSHVALAAMGEGDVRDAVGDLVDAADGAGRGIHRPARAAREGGARPHQRHRRHARDAAARPPRSVDAARHRRRRGRHVDREPAGHRRRLRRRPHGAAPAGRAGGIGREPARVPRRLAHHGVAPRPGRVHARAGRVLAALLAAGARRRARHRRLRPD